MDDFTPLNLYENNEIDKNSEVKEENHDVEVTKEETIVVETTECSENAGNETAEMAEVAEEEVVNTEETQSDRLDSILELQQQLSEKIETLNTLFNTRIMHTDHEEKIVDQMHKELQKYKKDMYAQLVRPILLDVIEVRNSIMRMATTYLAKPEGEQNIPNKIFSDYAYDLQDILEKNSVDIYRSKSGDDFIPIKQRVIKKIPTKDESLHGRVAESLSCGYSYNGRIISAEKISVYYCEKNVEKNEKSEVIENG